jgi:hypothetical protein
MKHLGTAFFALGLLTACPAQAESWTCTYPGFGPNRQAVTIKLNSDGDDLIDQPAQLGAPKFHIVRDNSLAIVGVYTGAIRDTRGARIYEGAVLIEKSTGKFILTRAQIGIQPSYAEGLCTHNDD